MSTTDIYKYVHGETYTAEKIPQPIAGTGFVDVVGPDGITPLAFSAIALFDDALGTTELTIDVDFEVGSADAVYSAKESPTTVYRSIRILNAAYQSAVFYVDASVVGGYAIYNPYPVGSFYTQYPDADSSVLATAFPDTSRPADMFGGTWEAQWDDEGIDFHTERTSDTGLQTRTDGKQADQMQGWQLGATSDDTGTRNYWGRARTRDYIHSETSTAGGGTMILSTSAQGDAKMLKAVNDNTNGDIRKGTVTCDSNRLIRIWKRTA